MKTGERGFSLMEVMVVVGFSSIISYALFLALRVGDEQIRTADLKMTIQDSAREGLYKMVQELRQSAPDRVNIAAGGVSVSFNIPDPNNPVTSSYAVNWANSLLIQYARTNNNQIVRSNLSAIPIQQKVIANDVTSVTFTGNGADPTLVTIAMNVQRTLTNGRTVPAQPMPMTGQAEIRNT